MPRKIKIIQRYIIYINIDDGLLYQLWFLFIFLSHIIHPMFHLIAATTSSILVSLLTRLAEDSSKNTSARLAVNYITCFILGSALERGTATTICSTGIPFILILSIIAGLLYLFSFILLKESIKINGVGISSLFMKLGLVVTVLCSLVFFKERISALKTAAIATTILSVVFINTSNDGTKCRNYRILILLMLLGGLSDLPLKVFQTVGNESNRSLFLPSAFLTAFIISLIMTIKKKEAITKYDIIFGIAIGIPNYLSSHFLLRALYNIPAAIAYPTYSGTSVLILFLLGKTVFKEKTQNKEIAPLVLLFISLVMLSIG